MTKRMSEWMYRLIDGMIDGRWISSATSQKATVDSTFYIYTPQKISIKSRP